MKQNENYKTRGGVPRRRPGSSIKPGRISLGRRVNTIFTLTKGPQHESLSITAKAPWKHLQKIVSFSLQFTWAFSLLFSLAENVIMAHIFCEGDIGVMNRSKRICGVLSQRGGM